MSEDTTGGREAIEAMIGLLEEAVTLMDPITCALQKAGVPCTRSAVIGLVFVALREMKTGKEPLGEKAFLALMRALWKSLHVVPMGNDQVWQSEGGDA